MTAGLNLAARRFVARRGDLEAVGTWLTPPKGSPEPCLAILNRGDRTRAPFVILLANAHIWHPPPTGDRFAASLAAAGALLHLGLDPGLDLPQTIAPGTVNARALLAVGHEAQKRPLVRSLMTLVEDSLDDLYAMPPSPPAAPVGAPLGEILGRIGGRSVDQEITDHG